MPKFPQPTSNDRAISADSAALQLLRLTGDWSLCGWHSANHPSKTTKRLTRSAHTGGRFDVGGSTIDNVVLQSRRPVKVLADRDAHSDITSLRSKPVESLHFRFRFSGVLTIAEAACHCTGLQRNGAADSIPYGCAKPSSQTSNGGCVLLCSCPWATRCQQTVRHCRLRKFSSFMQQRTISSAHRCTILPGDLHMLCALL